MFSSITKLVFSILKDVAEKKSNEIHNEENIMTYHLKYPFLIF